ncbi:AraC family transcriptional regulator [Polaromonas sp.]|uniref:AraC family transcriptional regulator n=1 Tax=Polaromonas sp. TaxID=1869339 RepID=UPI0032632B26
MHIAPLIGPHGLYTVSVWPRSLLGSERVGWQGAYFADVYGAAEGIVDHGHERYCIQRGMHHEERRSLGARSWRSFEMGFSVWTREDEQRFHWRRGGRSQFLFIAPEHVHVLLGDTRPLAALGQQAAARSRTLALLFDALQADLAQGSPAGPLFGESLIAALVAHLSGMEAQAVNRREARACDGAIDLIGARFAEPITLKELADTAGLSMRQFTRAFRQATGRSPYQYVLQRRVDEAKTLIGRGLPLADVAVQCGFTDQSQLNRMFLRHAAVTPGQYRNRLLL